jgi:hypothetical protein
MNAGDFDWVLLMDFDTLFTNMAIRMEDFMNDARANHLDNLKTGQRWEDVDLIVSGDWYPPSYHTLKHLAKSSMLASCSSASPFGRDHFSTPFGLDVTAKT